MKQVGISGFVVACMFFGALLSLTNSVSALRCYQCTSGKSWNDCAANSRMKKCSSISQVSVMNRNVFLPDESEPACVSVYAKGMVAGVTGYSYSMDCLFNDKTLCRLDQDLFNQDIKIVECDLCTADLCNGLTLSIHNAILINI